jgi:hypothetical protein
MQEDLEKIWRDPWEIQEIEGDSEWEMQGDLEKIWRDPGEIGDRISRGDTGRSGIRNLMGIQEDL